MPSVGSGFQKITVVVPTYNERDNLPELLKLIAKLPLPNVHALIVDDNSPDGTGKVADSLASTSAGTVSVLHRTVKDGLGRAYVAGISHALDNGADVVLQMDADLSHPVAAVTAMVDALRRDDVAVVLGSRYTRGGSAAAGWHWRRKALSRWANLYVNLILRLRVKDATAGFKAWRAETLRRIDFSSVRSNGYSFQVEMNYRVIRHGLHIAEVPIRFSERAHGSSKMSLRVQVESAVMPWRLLFSKKRPRSSVSRPQPTRPVDDLETASDRGTAKRAYSE
jgi:dolichol-phosphate mannosyltransferase